ncbi:MAG: hypothetical protein K5871_05345 [Lachnospiraceae bacterium]|nr:hypothetical protein [Lachnospiraceae bacterium]
MKMIRNLKMAVCTVLAVLLAFNVIPAKGSDKVEARGASQAIAWGIDVSAWQGDIDWNAVKASGVQFVFIKCGGTIYGYDEKFAQNMAGATAAGLKIGVYIYSYATCVADGAVEAQWIINAIAPYSISMPVVLDLENYRQKALDPLTNAMICQTFCQIVEAAGYYPMVYSNRSMFRSTIGPFGYDKWVAQWTDYCYDESAAFWQATDSFSVPGIRGHVDLDYQFKDLSAYIIPYGFVSRDGFVYYYENYRRQANRFAAVDGSMYYVDAAGHVVAGALYPIGDYIYYFDPTGRMQVGFVNLGDGVRYFDENGHMVAGWQNIQGGMYFFDANGLMHTGFISDGVYTYYLNEVGVLQAGLFPVGDQVFYADAAGHICVGLQNVGGTIYYFDPAKGGAMATGFVSDGTYTYYFNEFGALQTGLFPVGGSVYGTDAAGHILVGMQNVGGATYYFDPAKGGALTTGFISDGVNSYCFGADGTLQKGLFAYGNGIYCSDDAGRIRTGLITINGMNFYFDPAKGGALLVNGTATDALGHVYMADASGLAVMVS